MKSLFNGIDSCSHTAVSSAQVIYSVMSFLSDCATATQGNLDLEK